MSQGPADTAADSRDLANVDMAAAWDGPEGDHWTDNANRYEATSARYGQTLLNSVALAGDEDILDIGCGTGRSTRDAARIASGGTTLGLDLSNRMLAHARQAAKAEALANVRFEQGDAQVYPFANGSFDVGISLFGSMFFNDPKAAFANIRGGLRSGGKLALLAWRDLPSNEWVAAIRGALAMGRELPMPPAGAPGPFAFADPGPFEHLLQGAGYRDVKVQQVDESLRFGKDADDAFSFVSTFGITKGLTHDLDDRTKTAALDALQALLVEHDTGDGVLFNASAWLISARVAP